MHVGVPVHHTRTGIRQLEPPGALPVSGEAYLVSYVDTDGPGFGVRVEAAAPTGVRRPIAELADVLPAGWVDAAPTDSFAPPVGPTRQIVLSAVQDLDADTTETRMLVVGLAGSGQPSVGVPINAFEPHWGPAGELAVAEQKPYAIDVATGTTSEIKRPAGVDTLGQWLADGAGWQAGRFEDSITAPGRLTFTGEFAPGVPTPYEVTGLERVFGAKGGTLTMAVSDGPNGSDAAIVEVRGDLAPPCQCVSWARFTNPGDDPRFQEATWDRAGTGVWIVFSQGTQRWLSHVQTPLVDAKVADLPPDRGWRIVGISADDRWVVLRVDESEPRPALALVDTREQGRHADRPAANDAGGPLRGPRETVRSPRPLGRRMNRPLRSRIALTTLAAGLVALTACTDPTAFASPSGVADASPTPRRTQAAASRPAPTPTATPSPSPSIPVATPVPHGPLEALLPGFSADGQYMDKRTATAADLTESESGRFVDGLLADLGRPPTAIEMAVAWGSWLRFTAVRVDGVSGDDLEDAVVRALFGIHPGTEAASDVAGRPVRVLAFADDGPFPVDGARVFSDGDVVFIVNASKDYDAVALETLKWTFKPKLEEVLPAALDGHELERFSAPAAAFNHGGDMCSFICPAEVPNLAKALGVDVAEMDVAGGLFREPPSLIVIVFRVPGQTSDALVEGRIQASGRADEPYVTPTKVSVGGKGVTWVNYSLFDDDFAREYLYATDGLLFSIRPAPSDGVTTTPLVAEAIAALP